MSCYEPAMVDTRLRNTVLKLASLWYRLLQLQTRHRLRSCMQVCILLLLLKECCHRTSGQLTLLVCFAARAQTHLKLENYLEASGDAQKAIDLDPRLGKAYLRRGYDCQFMMIKSMQKGKS